MKSVSTMSYRAVQCWMILARYAKNHQLLTYSDLSTELYGHPDAARTAGRLLIQDFYCLENGLPPLSSIVVNKTTNKPGVNIIVHLNEIEEHQQDVFNYDWTALLVPSAEELLSAFARG